MTGDYTDEDGLDHCCSRAWIEIYRATRMGRANGRWAVMVHMDGEIVAWAAYSPARGSYLNVVLLYGGPSRPIFGHDGTLPGFFRAVRDFIIDDAGATRAVLWDEGEP